MVVETTVLSYRLYRDSDLEAVLALWASDSGWGGISGEQFEEWYINTPYGKCLIIVATLEDERVVGQIIFTPSRMTMGGQTIKTLRASAPIVHNDVRQGNIRDYHHPAFTMMRAGLEMAVEAGYQYIYGYPSVGWLSLLRLFPKLINYPSDTAIVDCFSIALDNTVASPTSDPAYQVNIASRVTEEYGVLWQAAVTGFPITFGISRDTSWLPWALGPMLLLETRSATDGTLFGYIAVNKESGLIVDMLAASPEHLNIVFRLSVAFLHQNNPSRPVTNFSKLKGMITPNTLSFLQKIDYEKDNYRFGFTGVLLDDSIPFEKVEARSWYMTPLG